MDLFSVSVTKKSSSSIQIDIIDNSSEFRFFTTNGGMMQSFNFSITRGLILPEVQLGCILDDYPARVKNAIICKVVETCPELFPIWAGEMDEKRRTQLS